MYSVTPSTPETIAQEVYNRALDRLHATPRRVEIVRKSAGVNDLNAARTKPNPEYNRAAKHLRNAARRLDLAKGRVTVNAPLWWVSEESAAKGVQKYVKECQQLTKKTKKPQPQITQMLF